MQYCFEHAIPHSVFLGREVSPGDSLWLESDQDKVLAYQAFQSEFCQRCGTRDADWLRPDGRLLDHPPYYFEVHRCEGCVDMKKAFDELPSSVSRDGLVPVKKLNI